jgi:YesN/AraC family two-component response regulator
VDVDMPKINGFDVCKMIREKPFGFTTPIIILTVKDKMPDRVEGLSVGADTYLTKPFNIKGLVDRIPMVLEEKKKKLLNHTITRIPSFTRLIVRFDELTTTKNIMIYTDINDYFQYVSKYTEEMITVIKDLAELLLAEVDKSNLFHLDGPNFCFFVSKNEYAKKTKKVITKFQKIQKDVLKKIKENVKADLHLFSFDLEDKKGMNIRELRNPISSMKEKIIEEGNLLVEEKKKA